MNPFGPAPSSPADLQSVPGEQGPAISGYGVCSKATDLNFFLPASVKQADSALLFQNTLEHLQIILYTERMCPDKKS